MVAKKENWQNFLPSIHSWIEQTEFLHCKDPVPNAHHVVLVQPSADNPSAFELDAPHLSASLRQRVKEQGTKVGWTPKAGNLILSVDNASFVLVPAKGLQVSTAQKGRQAGLDAAASLKFLGVETLVCCEGQNIRALDIWDGLSQGYYAVDEFKAEKTTSKVPGKVYILGPETNKSLQKHYIAMGKAQCLVRALGDSPPNWLNSEKFAEIASAMSGQMGVRCKIQGREEIEVMGMGAFHSVAKGTYTDPKLITIEIEGRDRTRTIALAGKGLTFDSGGISLKDPKGMDQMKYDMCGGAAVLGTAYFLSQVQAPTNVVCIIGAVENLPGNQASRPGDIVQAMNGKTIEILNTDAEGRLVLADLLHYAVSNYHPEFVVDIATLTSAVVIALGHVGSGLMSNSDRLTQFLLQGAETLGEPLWHLPLWPELDEEIKSVVADYKNITTESVGAKSLSAGSFLKAFVGKTPWGHLDIAGTAWDCKATGFPKEGASSVGLRTLTRACLDFETL
ncbi:MAG: leucyl aminopeptidase [Deltaproteobacteria bacterium]|nr:leucyl aminopeptidase [Deltaproteobacteria bacterium]